MGEAHGLEGISLEEARERIACAQGTLGSVQAFYDGTVRGRIRSRLGFMRRDHQRSLGENASLVMLGLEASVQEEAGAAYRGEKPIEETALHASQTVLFDSMTYLAWFRNTGVKVYHGPSLFD